MSRHGRTRSPTNITPRFPTAPNIVLDLPLNSTSPVKAWDYSTKGNHGTITGATYTTGQKGLCLHFDADLDRVNCGHDSSLNLRSTWTLETWVYLTSFPWVVNHIVVKENNANIIWRRDQDDFYTEDFYEGADYYSVGGGLALNEWNHLTAVFDWGNTDVLFYINGDYVNTVNTGYRYHGGNYDLYLGYLDWDDESIRGYIESVKLFDSLLSAAQIKRRYEQSKYFYVRGS